MTLTFDQPHVILRDDPMLWQWDNWLDDHELSVLLANLGQLVYTQGYSKHAGGQHQVTDRRRALNHIVTDQDPVVFQQLEQKVADFLAQPKDHFEPAVILQYQSQGHFKPHHDFNRQKWRGVTSHRLATLILYLNHDFDGGVTEFPMLGIKVSPRAGRVVFWRYDYQDAAKNQLLMHSSEKVFAGVKHAMVFFLRDRPFVGAQRQRMVY